MADAKMQIIIDGNAQGATNAAKQAEGSISNLGSTLKNLAIGGGALVLASKAFQLLEKGIGIAISTLQDCVSEAANAEMQLTKLDTALQSTGNYTKAGSDELVAYAESLQSMTAFEDDAIVGVEAMLATFKLSNEEIKVATQATLDLAAATGQDLQSAAILMGKAMVGETGMLKRYGIMVDENKLATEGWKAVIDEINVEFGGQAVAQGDTYSGMLERMKNNIGNLKETIGGELLPELKQMMDKFQTGGGFEKLQEWVGKAAAKIKEFLDALMGADWSSVIAAVENLGETLGVLITGDSSFETAEEKAQNFADTLAGLVDLVARLAIGAKLLSEAVMLSWRSFDLFSQDFSEGFVDRLQTDWQAWLETFRRGISETDLLINGYDKATESTVKYSDGLIGAIDATNTAIPTTDNLNNSVSGAADAAYALENGLIAVNGGYIRVEDAANKTAEAVKNVAGGIGAVEGAADGATKEVDNLTAGLFGLFNINIDLEDAAEKYEKALKELAETTKSITASEETKKEASDNATIATLQYMESIEKAIESDKTSNEEKRQLMNVYTLLGVEAIKTGDIQKTEFTGVATELKKHIDNTIIPGFARAASSARDYIATLEGIPRYISVEIAQHYTGEGTTNVGNIAAHMGSLRQSGGMIKNNVFATDLNIPLVKGEAVLPKPIVQAIKQGNSSFAGINMGNDGGSVQNYFNISSLVVREDADVERIAQELYGMQQSSLRGAGIR